jgi:hypothetical protein
LLDAFREVGMGITDAPSEIRMKNEFSGDLSPPIALTELEQKTYQRLVGERLRQRLEAQVQSPAWDKRTAVSQKKELELQLRLAREYAERQVYEKMDAESRRKRMAEGRLKLKAPPKALAPA